jgi:protocatechuate 3,4-dioxygenase alpha subunit
MTRTPTASQTVGPFWHMLDDPTTSDLTRFGATGARLLLSGRVIDGNNEPVNDACVEIWQATPAASPEFPGWGRCATNAHGAFRFATLEPDATEPCAAVCVFARGLSRPLWTRVYFVDVAGVTSYSDPLLAQLSPARRSTLLARRDESGWRWDIRLQGDNETVFLEI